MYRNDISSIFAFIDWKSKSNDFDRKWDEQPFLNDPRHSLRAPNQIPDLHQQLQLVL